MKPIVAWVVAPLEDRGRTGLTLIEIMSDAFLQPGGTQKGMLPVQPDDLNGVAVITLSIDYVEFADGSSWGPDNEHRSIMIDGVLTGRHAAIKEMMDMVSNSDWDQISLLLNTPSREINVTIWDKTRPEQWQRGYRTGYSSAVTRLAEVKDQGAEKISATLESMQ